MAKSAGCKNRNMVSLNQQDYPAEVCVFLLICV